MFSPLEQFELYLYFKNELFFFSFLITNLNVYLLLNSLILLLILLSTVINMHIIPTRWEVVSEFFYLFLLSITKQQVGHAGLIFLPAFITCFFFILTSNLSGLLPFSFTITAQLFVTFFLALSFNLGFLIFGLEKHKIKFFGLFVPKGVPFILLPLITIIEIMSYMLRTFSLAIRLFANMMAGHTLLHILASFALIIPNVFLATIPLILVLAIFALEFCIAFLQAYVFVVLLNIYSKDAVSINH